MTGWRKRQIVEKQDYFHKKTHCNKMLMGLLGSQAMIDQWWLSQNLSFELKTPQEVFDAGASGQKAVIDYLAGHCYGGYF